MKANRTTATCAVCGQFKRCKISRKDGQTRCKACRRARKFERKARRAAPRPAATRSIGLPELRATFDRANAGVMITGRPDAGHTVRLVYREPVGLRVLGDYVRMDRDGRPVEDAPTSPRLRLPAHSVFFGG